MGWTLPVGAQSARLPHMGHLTAPRPLPSSEFRLSVHYCRYCTWQSVSGMSSPGAQVCHGGMAAWQLGNLAAWQRRLGDRSFKSSPVHLHKPSWQDSSGHFDTESM